MVICLIKDERVRHSDGFPVYYLSTSPFGAPGKFLSEVKIVEKFKLNFKEGDRKFFEELINWGVLGVGTPSRKEKLIKREKLEENQ